MAVATDCKRQQGICCLLAMCVAKKQQITFSWLVILIHPLELRAINHVSQTKCTLRGCPCTCPKAMCNHEGLHRENRTAWPRSRGHMISSRTHHPIFGYFSILGTLRMAVCLPGFQQLKGRQFWSAHPQPLRLEFKRLSMRCLDAF